MYQTESQSLRKQQPTIPPLTMKEKSQFKFFISNVTFYWKEEFSSLISDKNIMLVIFVAPLLYPALYSCIYDNEVVKEAPMVVVDHCNSHESRYFMRLCDATKEVKIVSTFNDLESAKKSLYKKEAYCIMEIPTNFSKKIAQKERSYISLYSDMSSLLYYKNFLITATNVSLQMNRDLQGKHTTNKTKEEERRIIQPIKYNETILFNPSNGFASFLIPAILMLIIQQTILLSICALNGKRREEGYFIKQRTIPQKLHPISQIIGQALCYVLIYLFIGLYIMFTIPTLFSFPQMGDFIDLISIYLPYILASIFLGISLTIFIKEMEESYLYIVFTSLIFIFLSGISWPSSAIPNAWRLLSYLIPCTFGIEGYIKINSMDAELADIKFEYFGLWIQTLIYFLLSIYVTKRKYLR